MRSLGVMVDCSRDAVYKPETLKEFIKLLSSMGYNSLQLYTEDVYEIEGEPYFGYLRGRYTKAELKDLDRFARGYGVELIPCIQTLAHLGGITRWGEYGQCTDTGDILLAGEDRTYLLIEKMFATCAECFGSRRINIGMDEAHMVGLGKYLDLHGYKNRFDILLEHLNRVNEIALRYGFRIMMWSDMFFRLAMNGAYDCSDGKTIPQEIMDAVPENVDLIYWDYYSVDKRRYEKMLAAHRKFNRGVVFAGGAWSWTGFAPSNRFSVRASREALSACRDGGIDDLFVTIWKDDGAECSLFASLPSLYCFAEFARGNFDMVGIKKDFGVKYGIDLDTFYSLDEINLYEQDDRICNPCKYMLYSDPFFGIFDASIKEEDAEKFAKVKKKLLQGGSNEKFGYIFQTLAALCEVLEIKFTLGIRTRQAYREGVPNMEKLIDDYKKLERRIEKFMLLFRQQWDKECKMNGFEKHDIRLGGLIQRVRHCREILEKYRSGAYQRIPALEEEILPFGNGRTKEDLFNFNVWHMSAMIKPFS